MKNYVNCPICNNPLLNELSTSRRNRGEIWGKSCVSINHSFWMIVEQDIVSAMSISLDMDKNIVAHWVTGETYGNVQQLYIVKGKNVDVYKHGVWIPFFEPDFSNYNKLVQKLKIYITFS